MSNLIEFSGNFLSNGKYVPFQVEIHAPVLDGPDYRCLVVSPQLFTKPANVYGVSRNQAIRLAVKIVQAALTSLVITDDDASDESEDPVPYRE